jgi:N-acetylmuramoyl-L-alanine amidase
MADAEGHREPRARRPVLALLSVVGVLTVVIALLAGGGADAPASTTAGDGHAAGARQPVAGAPGSAGPSTSVAGGVPLDPARFARGACVRFAPSGRGNGRTVFIDAGHGGIDPGGRGVTETGTVIYEADQNLAIELETMHLLRAEGFEVVVSRTGNTDVVKPTAADLTGGVFSVTGARADVAARDACANLARATILVGIYFDAGTSPDDAGSITAYDPTRPFADKSRRLAAHLQRDVLARMNARGWQIPDDGVEPDTTLGGIPLTTTAAAYPHLLLLGPADPGWFTTPSQMPGALIEPLFISDPFEGSIADSAAGHQAIAEGLALAVEQYFDDASR